MVQKLTVVGRYCINNLFDSFYTPSNIFYLGLSLVSIPFDLQNAQTQLVNAI